LFQLPADTLRNLLITSAAAAAVQSQSKQNGGMMQDPKAHAAQITAALTSNPAYLQMLAALTQQHQKQKPPTQQPGQKKL
jgi:hypothetical protein